MPITVQYLTARKGRKMKNIQAIALVLIVTMLAGCSGMSMQTVHAAPPTSATSGPSPQLWNWPTCSFTGSPLSVAEAFALGDVQSDGSTVDEGDDYLEISQPVFSSLCIADTSYVTKFAHSVQSIGLQMGSGKDAIQEWAFWVDVILPSGKTYRVPKLQFDKHTDYRGNFNTTLEIHWTLPAGTTIRIRRPAVICVSDPSKSCITGQSITFVGK